MSDVAAADSSDQPPNSPAPHPVWRRVARFALHLTITGVLATIAFRAALVRGLWQPAQVTGSSMAETLVGDHWSVTCHDCDYHYRVDADQPPADRQTVCPNCGFSQDLTATPAAHLRPGDGVRIDRWPAFRQRFAPNWRRGDLVAFYPHDEPNDLAIKRVVGLPNETVTLRDGDVWIDGQPWRKSWVEFLEVAVVVHDDRWRPRGDSDYAERWRPDSDSTAWRSVGTRHVCDTTKVSGDRGSDGDNSANAVRHWLRFHPLAGYGRTASIDERAPIRDVDFYNADVSRALQGVRDQILAGSFHFSSDADLLVKLDNGREEVEFALRAGELLELRSLTPTSTFAPAVTNFRLPANRPVRIALGQFDRRLIVVVEGHVVASCDGIHADDGAEQPTGAATRPKGFPWSIGVARGHVEVSHLKILRDIHYLPPRSPRQPTTWSLGADEWFVLGDNPTTSVDSRDWPTGGVPSRRLYGRVFR